MKALRLSADSGFSNEQGPRRRRAEQGVPDRGRFPARGVPCLAPVPLGILRIDFYRMSFDPARRFGAMRWYVAVALALLAVATFGPMPAAAATAQKIVSVDVTGNLHVPTQTIMSVIAARPGQDVRPQGRSGRLSADQRPGLTFPTSRRRSFGSARTASRSRIASSRTQ